MIEHMALVQLVAMATVRERRLFHSVLAQVWLLFESGVYSRAVSVQSYTVLPMKSKSSRLLNVTAWGEHQTGGNSGHLTLFANNLTPPNSQCHKLGSILKLCVKH